MKHPSLNHLEPSILGALLLLGGCLLLWPPLMLGRLLLGLLGIDEGGER